MPEMETLLQMLEMNGFSYIESFSSSAKTVLCCAVSNVSRKCYNTVSIKQTILFETHCVHPKNFSIIMVLGRLDLEQWSSSVVLHGSMLVFLLISSYWPGVTVKQLLDWIGFLWRTRLQNSLEDTVGVLIFLNFFFTFFVLLCFLLSSQAFVGNKSPPLQKLLNCNSASPCGFFAGTCFIR